MCVNVGNSVYNNVIDSNCATNDTKKIVKYRPSENLIAARVIKEKELSEKKGRWFTKLTFGLKSLPNVN